MFPGIIKTVCTLLLLDSGRAAAAISQEGSDCDAVEESILLQKQGVQEMELNLDYAYNTSSNDSANNSWQYCYFQSGMECVTGEGALEVATTCPTPGKKPNSETASGEDPSCGGFDMQFWNTWHVYDRSRPKGAGQHFLKTNETGGCNNCPPFEGSGSCAGYVRLGPGKVPCYMHGSFGQWTNETGSCTSKKYAAQVKDKAGYETWGKLWHATYLQATGGDSTKIALVTIPDPLDPSQEIEAAMSIGHGVLDGACGSTALIKNTVPGKGTFYLLNFQEGMRSWSLELVKQAGNWLVQGHFNNGKYGIQPPVLNYDFANQTAFERLLSKVTVKTFNPPW